MAREIKNYKTAQLQYYQGKLCLRMFHEPSVGELCFVVAKEDGHVCWPVRVREFKQESGRWEGFNFVVTKYEDAPIQE